MKDRRNTSLSISTLSFSSTEPSPVDPPTQIQTEKGRLLFLPTRPFDEALPSPLIKHAQEQKARQPAIRRRLVQSIICALLLGSLLIWRISLWQASSQLAFVSNIGVSSQILDPALAIKSTVPEVVAFVDARGRRRWTVSIPDSAAFPLAPSEYDQLCSSSHIVSSAIRADAHRPSRFLRGSRDSYYAVDPSYMQVHEAITHNVLASNITIPVAVVGHDQTAGSATCERSLTFVLEPEEAGFGKALLSLWTSYGLARREGRAFFVEDSRWQYGDYTSFFPAPPKPTCLPPAASEVVPCPHHVDHLVVSSATLPQVFGKDFHDHFQSRYRMDIGKQRDIFALARDGYEALFALGNTEDASYAHQRATSIRDRASASGHPVIGMHIRHGDRHPFEYEFSHDYLPLSRFANAALDLLSASPRPAHANLSAPVPVYMSSDDPDVASDPDLAFAGASLERAQDRIVLASNKNFRPEAPARPGGVNFVKHVDEFAGWEGGFFSSLFRNLGRAKKLPPPTFSSAREQKEQMEALFRQRMGNGPVREMNDEERKAEENANAMRGLIGRGYLLDLEVLSKSDTLVCAVSSATCRILGVMMGWDKVKSGKWVNVDDGRGWSFDGEH